MKWIIIVINLIVLVNSTAAIARQEKIIKKPLGLKPTKSPKSIIDEFRHLSPEDVEFLKQVDKQFKVHGDKIKIKVERENKTTANKNTKRTIDSSLGYGYQNPHQQNYYFSQPHLMHPSQDVPGNKNGYREMATDIEIQQSHSYEIKDGDYNQNFQSATAQNYQHEQVYEDPVPVIVLRIPGPQKYAIHLQALLQQYLEIRAAQYIKALEDQERHGHLMHPQHYVAQQAHQMQYAPMQYSAMHMYQQPLYHQEQHRQHQYQQQAYPEYYQVHHGQSQHIPAGEQSYYKHAQPMHHQQTHEEYQQVAPVHHQQAEPDHHQQTHEEYQQVTPVHQSESQEYHHSLKVHHQQEYPSSYINFVTPSYDHVETSHHHSEPAHEDHSLETSENYPSDKHTQVIFKKKKNRVHRPYHPQPIVVPEQHEHHHEEESYHHHSEHIHHEKIHHEVHESQHHEPNYSHEHTAEAGVVSITERSKGPVNYHVLSPTLAPNHEELHERHNPKRMAAPFTKEQFDKARRMMMKSKRNRGSMKKAERSEEEDVKTR